MGSGAAVSSAEVSAGVSAYRKACGGSLLIITHNLRILDALEVDRTHILADGRVAAEGGAELAEAVNQNGFEAYAGKDAT